MMAAFWLPLPHRKRVFAGWDRLRQVPSLIDGAPQIWRNSKGGKRDFRSRPLIWRECLQHNKNLAPCSRGCGILRTSGLVANAPLVGAVSRHTVHAPVCALRRKGFTARDASSSPAASCFHTSARAPALPFPLILFLLKPVKKIVAMILGRSIRNWWQGLPAHKQELLKHSVRKNKWRIVLGVCGLTGLIVTYLWLHYDTSQITGRSRLLVFSQRQLLELAAIEYESMLKTYEGTLVPETDQAYHTVQFVFNHLVEKNKDVPGMSRIKWNINVVQDAEINAFILPNGQVFVLTGLLSAVADTDQLACILAHEMAHCLLAHGAEHASFVQLLDFLSLIILTLIWAVFPRDSLALLGQWIQSKLVKLASSDRQQMLEGAQKRELRYMQSSVLYAVHVFQTVLQEVGDRGRRDWTAARCKGMR
ncbi:metalloendopeptidase OMA1, mitochondrial isoform X3 [Callorhinchus milii]|uniref:metalloendopeptidase OMA1, mitochondrial isoform X3 n=1 Tax=Callorhinchus milii TaxID=7868 RepID=UPI001C3FD86E|nr:metalloendopeptidase OMA1, mitochondrial isoform X3 [Callorhinchus milii]